MRTTVGIALNGLVGLAAASNAGSDFDWTSITPSEHLEYHDCFDDFQLPAVVADDDASFAGSVFTNPGGPGGSGVDILLRDGKHLRDVLDKPGRRHYEMVSFDPRGISNSWPRANCFPNDMLGRDAALLERRGYGPLNSDGALPYVLALQRGIGQRCQDADESGANGGQILGYMATPNVARDMVHMVDKIAELRAREADARDDRLELKRRSSPEATGDDDDLPRLQYIGYSYGTVLGNYFASMFPGRVGRLLLDGVVNANDYSSGPGWLTNLKNTDELADRFFSDCHLAGPKACALARDNDAAVKGRFYEWLAKLDEEPISAVSPSGAVVVISSQDIRELLVQGFYKPRASFRGFAQAVDDAMRGNTSAIVKKLFDRNIPVLKNVCDADGGPEGFFQEAGAGVLCADGDDVSGHSLSWWKLYVRRLVGTSAVYGAYWANVRMACNAWNSYFRPNWVFKGPFTTPPVAYSSDGSGKPLPGHPAAPILFASNRLDPVTPLAAARAMAAQHPGAGLLIAEALGHCTMGNGDSDCLHKHIADYFDTGVVPDGEAVCEADCGPWDEECDGVGAQAIPKRARAIIDIILWECFDRELC